MPKGLIKQKFEPVNKGLNQPFKPMKPIKGIGPIVDKPIKPIKPLDPIVSPVKPGFPIKPIKPVDPIVGPIKPFPVKPFPIKPIDKPDFPIKPIKPIKPFPPIVKPWPIKPICPPHKHCPPHWASHCYPWWVDFGGSCGGYVVSTPVVIEVPVVIEAEQVEVEQLPEVRVGATLELPGQGFGKEAGGVMLRIGDVSLACLVGAWDADRVQATLPMLGLAQPQRAELVVMLPDGKFAQVVPVMLLPALPPE
jgi:hypothetical protein